MEITERVAFRVTRDGDTEISDDADDLLEAVESEVRKRRFGAVVRMEGSSSISREMLARLEERLRVPTHQGHPLPGLLHPPHLPQLHRLDRPHPQDEAWASL